MSQIQSTSRQNCVLLAVLCGRYAEKQRTPARLAPEAKRVRLSYPFPELGSSGRLEVHKLINPTVEQFREAQRAVQPNLLYLQGQQLENEKEIGTLVWGDADVSDLQTFSSLINPPFPTIIRGSKLQNRVSAAAPPLQAETLSRGVVTMCCDTTTCSSSHVSLVSGSVQTCFDDQLLESHIKNEIIEKSQLVRALSNSEDNKPSSAEPLTSMSMACGASTFEVCMALPKWAAQVLKHLAPEISYKSLVALGIACVNGTPISSFDKQDADRLLFFCMNQ